MSDSRTIWFDGSVVPWEQAKVHVWDEVAARGANVFEGVIAFWRAERGCHDVLALDEHLTRLRDSARLADITLTLSDDEIISAITQVAARFSGSDIYLRPTAYVRSGRSSLSPGAEAGFFIGAFANGQRSEERRDVTAAVSTYRRGGQDPISGLAKSGGTYLDFRMFERERIRWGVDNVVFLDPDGYVAEADGAAILVACADGRLVAPSAQESSLRSITSGLVLRLAAGLGLTTERRRVRREDLYAGCVLLAGTLVGVKRVRELDAFDARLTRGWDLGGQLADAYRDLCSGDAAGLKVFTPLTGVGDER